jgi:hypothetical protein
LPAFVAPAPPPVVVIPGTYVYYAPGLTVDILFYRGYWYRPHGDRWYRSRSYNGPWGFVVPRNVPRALISLPPHYREVGPGRRHIPYGQLKKNWGKWERERHWKNDPNWRDDFRGRPRNEPDLRKQVRVDKRPDPRKRDRVDKRPDLRKQVRVDKRPDPRKRDRVDKRPDPRKRDREDKEFGFPGPDGRGGR